MVIEISVDDGMKHDLRVADMLKHYGFRGIFFIPVNRTELTTYEINLIAQNHEIGGHTVNHPADLKLVDDLFLEYELTEPHNYFTMILKNKQLLTKFAYPRGRFNQHVSDMVAQAGYTYARTTRVGRTKLSNNPYQIDTSMHLFYRKEYGDNTLMEWFYKTLEQAQGPEQGYYHLFMHSDEVDRFDLWPTLEKILKELSKHHD